MKEISVHLDGLGHPVDVHFDSGEGTPIQAFLFLTSVPTDPPAGHVLAYGNSNIVGQMILNFWKNSVFQNPEGAAVIEAVARDIIRAADAHRKEWPGAVTERTN